jgi:transposase
MRPMVKAMLTHHYTYAYGGASPLNGKFDSPVLPHVNTQCMRLLLSEIGRRFPNENIIMELDGAGWHQWKNFALPHNLRLHFLPPYSPELNPQEHIWEELRKKYFHNQAFDCLDALEDQLIEGLRRLELQPQIVKSIAAWIWIINSVSIAN